MYARTNRQVLINAAHFLRIYHKSGSEISHILKNESLLTESCAEMCYLEQKEEIIDTSNVRNVLTQNGLRILNDYFDDGFYSKASLVFKYLKENEYLKSKSLKYFSERFAKKLLESLTFQVIENKSLTQSILIALALFDPEIIICDVIQNIIPELKFLDKITVLFENLKNFAPPNAERINIFDDLNVSEVTLCFPNQDFFSNWISDFKTQIKEYSMKLSDNSNVDLDVRLLEKLELDERFIESIAQRIKACKSKDNQVKLKNELTEVFDRLMKCIQNSIKTGQVRVDENLQPKLDSIFEIEIPTNDFMDTTVSFSQILKNKSNIIITIHKNELNSRATEYIKMKSNFYYAISICDQLLKTDGNDRTRAFNSFIDKNITSLFVEASISQISECYNFIKNSESELSALFWLSHIIENFDDTLKNAVLAKLDLDLDALKYKYSNQQALLVNLIPNSDNLISPVHENSNGLPLREILPHFTPF